MANFTTEEAKAPMDYVLYRAWAETELLYIGVTASQRSRFKYHSRYSAWWRWKTSISLEHLGSIDRETARQAESQAIRNEHPLYNTMGNICLLPNCLDAAVADLMCTEHYANYLMPYPWAPQSLLAIRNGAVALDRHKRGRR